MFDISLFLRGMCIMIENIQFDEKIIYSGNNSYLDELADKQYYKSAAKQIEKDPHINWGSSLNILIFSSRSSGKSSGLFEYLSEKTDVSNVKVVHSLNEVQAYANDTIPDILIIAAYQEDTEEYKFCDIVIERNKKALVLLYAPLDEQTKKICIKNRIEYAFSTNKPLADFTAYLKDSYISRS